MASFCKLVSLDQLLAFLILSDSLGFERVLSLFGNFSKDVQEPFNNYLAYITGLTSAFLKMLFLYKIFSVSVKSRGLKSTCRFLR